MYFEQGQGNAGDFSKIGKEKGKTKLVICICLLYTSDAADE